MPARMTPGGNDCIMSRLQNFMKSFSLYHLPNKYECLTICFLGTIMPFTCTTCEKSFPGMARYKDHMFSKHKVAGLFKCGWCSSLNVNSVTLDVVCSNFQHIFRNFSRLRRDKLFLSEISWVAHCNTLTEYQTDNSTLVQYSFNHDLHFRSLLQALQHVQNTGATSL